MEMSLDPLDQEMTLSFCDLEYTVTLANPRPNQDRYLKLLNGITGYCQPRKLTALMGASGAGKTTLLDVLAGRKTQGDIEGTVAVNGHVIDPRELAPHVGYVEQFGIHSPTATVQEALAFSTVLRTQFSEEKRRSWAAQVSATLLLDSIPDKLCEELSVEEDKRLTIAVEMCANPAILFLDEPTSGLDARAAQIVMSAMRQVADSGRTIISTIHQPNIDIFQSFDSLLLLQRGGSTVYFGELGEGESHLIDYFQAIPKVEECPDAYNPASWMLEVITDQRIDFPQSYSESKLCGQQVDVVDALLAAPTGVGVNQDAGFKASTVVQLKQLLHRSTLMYWRSPNFSFARLFVIGFVSLLMGAVIFKQEPKTAADVQTRITVVGFSIMLGGTYNLYTIVPWTTNQRAVFYRERSSGMYSSWSYVAASIVEVPYIFVESAIGINIMYWMIGFKDDWDAFLFFWLIYFLYISLMTFCGMVFSALTPDTQSGTLIVILFYQICTLFAGTQVPPSSIPIYYKWLYWGSPQRWATEGVIVTQFYGDQTKICNPQGTIVDTVIFGGKSYSIDDLSKMVGDKVAQLASLCTPSGSLTLTQDDVASLLNGNVTEHMTSEVSGQVTKMGEYVLDEASGFLRGYHYDYRWYDVLVLCCWIVFARILLIWITAKVNHLKR